MGYNSITYVSEKTKDPDLLKYLQEELNEYNEIVTEASETMVEKNKSPKEKGPMSQIGLWSGVQMNTLVDKSSDHIAEMMIQGSMMGVIDMARCLRKYSDAETKTKKLGEKLIETEEKNIQSMKRFLQ